MKKTVIFIVLVMIPFITITQGVFADYYSDHTLLRSGMRGSEVTNLQNDLKELGYFTAGSTGYFGSVTLQAVKTYQKGNALTADGVVGPVTAKEIKIDTTLARAKDYQGVPYVWGGVTPAGFDCSGFVHYVFLKEGIVLPRMSEDQYQQGTWVSKSLLKQGDLVFFTTYKPGPSHVGIYLGSGKFIHASSGAGKVTISDLGNSYYTERYIGAKRVIR